MQNANPTYIFFDIETTGLRRDADILEFGALVCDENLALKEVINKYYRFDGQIPESALAVNGLTTVKLEMFAETDWLKGAEEIYDLFSTPNLVVCGHNIANYDIPVLKNALERAGFCINPDKFQVVDTLKLCRSEFSSESKHNLAASTEHVLKLMKSSMKQLKKCYTGIDMIADKMYDEDTYFHNAVFDSFCTYVIYQYLRG